METSLWTDDELGSVCAVEGDGCGAGVVCTGAGEGDVAVCAGEGGGCGAGAVAVCIGVDGAVDGVGGGDGTEFWLMPLEFRVLWLLESGVPPPLVCG